MIIDAHVHISLYQGNADTLGQSKDTLLREMERLGIDYAIVIPDNTERQPRIAGLETARRLIGESDPLFLLGSPDVLAGRTNEVERYEQLMEEGVVRGLKLFPGHEPY